MTDADPELTVSIIKSEDDPDTPNEPGVNQNEQKDTAAEEQPQEQKDAQDQPAAEPTDTGEGAEKKEGEEPDEKPPEETADTAEEGEESTETGDGTTVSQNAALANPSGVQTASGGGGGAGGGGNNGPTAPAGPRSPRFNIYETDQLDKGGVPFNDAALQLFSNFGKGFTKLCHKINSAALGVFSKPISSCRVLGEALVDIGELMSGTMHELAQKDTGLTPLGQAVKHNNQQDHAAAQMAFMNTFMSDIAEVEQMDIDGLYGKIQQLVNLRESGLDLNGTTFHPVDANGNVSANVLGLRDIVMYLNGDKTCGGTCADVRATSDNGQTYTSVSQQQVRQLNSYVFEYNRANKVLAKQIQIRSKDLDSQKKYEDYVKQTTEILHRTWISDHDKGVDYVAHSLQNGTTYQATCAQAFAREQGVLDDKGMINIPLMTRTSPKDRNKIMDEIITKLHTDPNLSITDKDQLMALWDLCNLTNWVNATIKSKMRNKAVKTEKIRTLERLLKRYLTSADLHKRLGAMGIDASDANNTQLNIYDYDDRLAEDPDARRELILETKYNPSVPVWDEESKAAITGSPGTELMVQNGIPITMLGMGFMNGTTTTEFQDSNLTLAKTHANQQTMVADRALQRMYTLISENFSYPAFAVALKSFGLGSDKDFDGEENEYAARWNSIMLDPMQVYAKDFEAEFAINITPQTPFNMFDEKTWINNECMKSYLRNQPVNLTSVQGLADPQGNPYGPKASIYKVYMDYLAASNAGNQALADSLKQIVEANMVSIGAHMVTQAGRMAIACKGLKDKLKSPMVATRVAELEGLMTLQSATGIPVSLDAEVIAAITDYFTSSEEIKDSNGNTIYRRLSPGCNPIHTVDLYDYKSKTNQPCQLVLDSIGNKLRPIPVVTSTGSEEAFEKAVHMAIDNLERIRSGGGGSILRPSDAEELIHRLNRLLPGEQTVYPENKLCTDVMMPTQWDPLNDYSMESRMAFDDLCADPVKLTTLERTMDTHMTEVINKYASQGRDDLITQSAVTYMVASTGAIFAQFRKRYMNNPDMPDDYMSATLKWINDQYLDADQKMLLRDLVPDLYNRDLSEDEISESIIRALQLECAKPASYEKDVAVKGMLDFLGGLFATLDNLCSLRECEIAVANKKLEELPTVPPTIIPHKLAFRKYRGFDPQVISP